MSIEKNQMTSSGLETMLYIISRKIYVYKKYSLKQSFGSVLKILLHVGIQKRRFYGYAGDRCLGSDNGCCNSNRKYPRL
jgi:hypothetical protein